MLESLMYFIATDAAGFEDIDSVAIKYIKDSSILLIEVPMNNSN